MMERLVKTMKMLKKKMKRLMKKFKRLMKKIKKITVNRGGLELKGRIGTTGLRPESRLTPLSVLIHPG